jgi:hypothetical protein
VFPAAAVGARWRTCCSPCRFWRGDRRRGGGRQRDADSDCSSSRSSGAADLAVFGAALAVSALSVRFGDVRDIVANVLTCPSS